MTNRMKPDLTSTSINQLKTIFDQSVTVLCQVPESEKTEEQTYKLHSSLLPIHLDPVSLRKRALRDAADALAILWKISRPVRAKLQSGELQFSRSSL